MSLHWQLFRVIHQMMEWKRKLERRGEQEGMQICWGREHTSWWNISWMITPRFSWSSLAIQTFLNFPYWEVSSWLCAVLNFTSLCVWIFLFPKKEAYSIKLLKVTNQLHRSSLKFQVQPDLPGLPWVAAWLASVDTFFFRHTPQAHMQPCTCMHKCSHVYKTKVGSSDAVYSLFTSQGRRPLSGLTSAVCPTFLPSNMPLSYGAPADAP